MDIQRVTELDPTVLQARQVTIDLSLLPQSGTETILPDGSTILFNLFNHAAFNVVFDRGEMSQDGVSLIWFGHIQGIASSEVTLVVRGKVVTANIRTPGETFYQVRYARDGVHVIYAIDQAAFPSERKPLMVDNLSDFGSSLSMVLPPGEIPRSDDGSLIDVMVVYTPAARQYAGGTAAMRSLIELAVAETNTGYANSGVFQRLRLVHTAEVAYSETTTKPFDDALLALRNPADGLMDEVHALRDTFGADMVNLVINRSTSCGLAFQMHTPSASFEANAFSAVSRICLTGNHGFAHELGHNLGATHERDSGLRGAFRYSFGYQAPDRRFRTIMAYECPGTCPKVNHWSNPDVLYLSQPTGIVHTDPDAADNRLTFNQNRQIAANWRPSVVRREAPTIILALGQGGEGKMEALGVDPGHHPNITWIQVPWPAYNAAVGGTHPVLCNLDNDPADELVVGLDSYPTMGGYVEIRDDRHTDYVHLDWIRVPWTDYNAANGATYPACGDFDGDGRDEIAIGLDSFPAQGGWIEIKDDSIANYAHLDWIRVPWADYNAANGATYPAAGDFDGDGRDEIAVGLDSFPAQGGWIEIKDDGNNGHAHLDWVRVPWTAYNTANGATYPAAGDFDGDDRDEIAVGLGSYPAQGGWVEIKDDGNNGYSHLDWVRVPWSAYNAANGATYPAAGDFDGDGRDEIAVGLGSYPAAGGWFEIKNDLDAGFGHLSWGRLHWPAYNSTNGETRPGPER